MDLAGAAPKVWRREKLDLFYQSRRTITAVVASERKFLIIDCEASSNYNLFIVSVNCYPDIVLWKIDKQNI